MNKRKDNHARIAEKRVRDIRDPDLAAAKALRKAIKRFGPKVMAPIIAAAAAVAAACCRRRREGQRDPGRRCGMSADQRTNLERRRAVLLARQQNHWTSTNDFNRCQEEIDSIEAALTEEPKKT